MDPELFVPDPDSTILKELINLNFKSIFRPVYSGRKYEIEIGRKLEDSSF